MQFKVGQKVKHSRYGEARVHSIYEPDQRSRFKGGVTLVLLTDPGKKLFARDRGGELPRCFEENRKRLTPLK